MLTLSRLFIHPVKSMRGLQISHALVQEHGLAGDRIFMLTEPDGTFITARRFTNLVLFTPVMVAEGIYLKAPDDSQAIIRFADFQQNPAPTEVWGNRFTALIAPDEINSWLSGFFPRPVQLRWVGSEITRRVKHQPDVPLGFADGYPFLLINETSLHDLQQRCPASIRAEQFRPNLVIAGAAAWEEDNWSVMRIGDILFDVRKPCSRCIFTTISPENAQKQPSGEPMTTLRRFRTAADNESDVDFGLNLTARSSGIVRVGDAVEIVATRAARLYSEMKPAQAPSVFPPNAVPEQAITLHYQGKQFVGNNQQTLLEQLEMQGFHIPYSCRAGVCGCCQLKLRSGKVTQMKTGAADSQGTLLACSCIPAGDLELEELPAPSKD